MKPLACQSSPVSLIAGASGRTRGRARGVPRRPGRDDRRAAGAGADVDRHVEVLGPELHPRGSSCQSSVARSSSEQPGGEAVPVGEERGARGVDVEPRRSSRSPRAVTSSVPPRAPARPGRRTASRSRPACGASDLAVRALARGGRLALGNLVQREPGRLEVCGHGPEPPVWAQPALLAPRLQLGVLAREIRTRRTSPPVTGRHHLARRGHVPARHRVVGEPRRRVDRRRVRARARAPRSARPGAQRPRSAGRGPSGVEEGGEGRRMVGLRAIVRQAWARAASPTPSTPRPPPARSSSSLRSGSGRAASSGPKTRSTSARFSARIPCEALGPVAENGSHCSAARRTGVTNSSTRARCATKESNARRSVRGRGGAARARDPRAWRSHAAEGSDSRVPASASGRSGGRIARRESAGARGDLLHRGPDHALLRSARGMPRRSPRASAVRESARPVGLGGGAHITLLAPTLGPRRRSRQRLRQASCPGSIRIAWERRRPRASALASPAIGWVRKRRDRRSRRARATRRPPIWGSASAPAPRPARDARTPARACRRRRPSRRRRSPRARARRRGTMCATSTSASRARRYVRFLSDRHSSGRSGWMLACVWKPTRQPSRSSRRRP